MMPKRKCTRLKEYDYSSGEVYFLTLCAENGKKIFGEIVGYAVPYGENKTQSPANQAIPALMSTLKRMTNKAAKTNLWQRAYHDHIIRDEHDYQRIWHYQTPPNGRSTAISKANQSLALLLISFLLSGKRRRCAYAAFVPVATAAPLSLFSNHPAISLPAASLKAAITSLPCMRPPEKE